ncbi:uncharacterized protein [Argopecten irradians]|uniref:uncharacterized protein n=1 Tax=Argopecten irradians TaxID=31199 RepID=UPI00371B816A
MEMKKDNHYIYDRHQSLVSRIFSSKRKPNKDTKTRETGTSLDKNGQVKTLCSQTLEPGNHGSPTDGFLPPIDNVKKMSLKEELRPASTASVNFDKPHEAYTAISFPHLSKQPAQLKRMPLPLKAVSLNGSLPLLQERSDVSMALVGRGDCLTEYCEELPPRVNMGYGDKILWNTKKNKHTKNKNSGVVDDLLPLPYIIACRANISERRRRCRRIR